MQSINLYYTSLWLYDWKECFAVRPIKYKIVKELQGKKTRKKKKDQEKIFSL